MPDASAPLSLTQTMGGSSLIATPSGWTADLGTVQAGVIIPSLAFGIYNSGSAATLVARFDTVTDDASIHVFGDTTQYQVSPGSGRGSVTVTFDTASAGHHVEQLVMHSTSVASDGTETALSDSLVAFSYDVAGASLPGPLPADAYSTLASPAYVNTSSVVLDGTTWARAQFLGGWANSDGLHLHPSTTEVSALGGNFLISTFHTLHADLATSGSAVQAFNIVGVKGGVVSTGDGSQDVIWSFVSDGSPTDSTGWISTGAGDDTITVTAVGRDAHTSELNRASILPYNIYPFSYARGETHYDGSLSSAVVDPGPGNDHVILAAPVVTTIALRAGDGNDTVDGYQSGTDHLELHGIAASDITVSSTGAGTLVTYGSGSILLNGVSGFDAGSITVLDVPPPMAPVTPSTPTNSATVVTDQAPSPATEAGAYVYPAADDWTVIGNLVTAFHDANGWWATMDQIEQFDWTPTGSMPSPTASSVVTTSGPTPADTNQAPPSAAASQAYVYPEANDWTAIGNLLTAFHDATGWWATLDQIEAQHWTPSGPAPSTTSGVEVAAPESANVPEVTTPGTAPVVDWDALAAQAETNFAATGHWLI